MSARFSTQGYLFGLGVAIVTPLLLFAVVLAGAYALYEDTRSKRAAEQLARQVGLVLDGALERNLALLRGIAASSSLAREDHFDFYREARRLAPGADMIILLRDLETKQLLNTQLPYDAQLPPAIPLTAEQRRHFERGQALVSDVYASPISGEQRFAIALPIMRDGKPVYLLTLTLPTSRIRDVVKVATLSEWIVSITDAKGVFVARSEWHEEVTGKKDLQAHQDKIIEPSRSFTAGGVTMLAGYHRSDLSGWLITASIPQATVLAPFWRSLGLLALAGCLALGLSTLLAYLMGRRFARATTGLGDQARAIGEGRPVHPFKTGLSDLDVVSQALVSASASIQQRERERQLLTNELNHRVKNTLATVQSLAHHTLKGGAAIDDLAKVLTGRLIALSKAHDLLTERNWEGAELHDTVAAVVSGYAAENRVFVGGPTVWLDPSTSVALSLTLNELATNAIKYGALSNDAGRIDLRWSIERARLVIHWSEQGGPVVQVPERKGFGSQLIEAAFSTPSASVDLKFAPAGLSCRIEIPPGSFRAAAGATP